jgi:hypothetical protein
MPNIESWQKARELLKHNRRELTDSIQNWIEKEKDASDKWVKFAYNNVTRAIMKASFENYKGNMPLSKVKFRDHLKEEEVYWLTRMEMLATDIIERIDEIFPKATAKEKYKMLAERLFTIGESLGRMLSETIQQLFETTKKREGNGNRNE